MYEVILFGGTDEGHKIADFLDSSGISYIVCVATDYGAEVLGNSNVRVGRMTAREMAEFFEKNAPKLVVDATHPYAGEVTANIRAACRCDYIRVVREDAAGYGREFRDAKSAAEYLKSTRGNILITTGSKEIELFSALAKRAYARVLPTAEAIEKCAAAGFEASRIICMQGPFSRELNSAVMKEFDIKYLVTKRSGKSGGFEEKIDAARENGVECVIINRPSVEEGATLEEAKKLISEYLK